MLVWYVCVVLWYGVFVLCCVDVWYGGVVVWLCGKVVWYGCVFVCCVCVVWLLGVTV